MHDPIGAAVTDYFDRLRDITVFAEQAVFRRADRSVDQGGTPINVEGMTVTPSFFRVAGVEPQLGRTFTEQEAEAGNESAVVISDSFWRNHFGGEPTVVGRSLRLDGRPYTVVGVMPRGFNPTDDDIELWTPIIFTPKERSDEARHSNNLAYVARLKPGATLEQAQAQIDVLNAANLDRFPAFRELLSTQAFTLSSIDCRTRWSRTSRATLYLDVGRGALRASDWLRQRRQPGSRPVARADEGARDAAGSWRRHLASCAPARG